MESVVQAQELDKLVYFDSSESILYVSESHAFHAQVRSYMQQLRAKNLSFVERQVPMEEVQERRAKRADNEDTASIEPSEMQRQATDMFRKAAALGASDIHLRVAKKQGITKVYFRVNGDLTLQAEHTAGWGSLMCSAIYTAMSDVSDPTYEPLSRQDGRISRRDRLPDGLVGIRIATTPMVDGHVMVLRLQYDDSDKSTDICDLGFFPEQKAAVARMQRRPTGINIIAGPTGSGKSTTLQRTLLDINQSCQGTKHILTVEDPPEYPMPGIVQTPVANASTEQERSAAFQLAIKAAMRLDPNVIMIGEMRDGPSARLAVQASMTGHQVWTTVHANSAFATIDRLVDLGVPLNVVTDPTIVTGLVCQRLLKVLCSCKVPFANVLARYGADDRERALAVAPVGDIFVAGAGCEKCNGTGIIARTAVAEVVVPDQELMDLMRSGEKERAVQLWRSRGNETILESAIRKISLGICDPFQAEEEVGPLSAIEKPRADNEELRTPRILDLNVVEQG